MKHRIKVFETGDFPQGNYNFERVKKIFGNVKDKIKTQFVHTSKAKGRKILLGEFDNFEVMPDGKVFADIEFNEKGKNYYEDGALEGISVEIPNDTLTKIACLPLGVKPQINGAEFEINETFQFEFEVLEGGTTVDFNAIIAFIVSNKLTVDEISKIFASLKLQITDKEAIGKLAREFEREELTLEQEKEKIRKEMKAEFETDEKIKNSEVKAKEFMQKNKLKITPGMKTVINEKVVQEFFKQENFEFEEKQVSTGTMLEQIFEKMPALIKPGEIIDDGDNGEFGDKKRDPIEAAKAQFGIK